MTTDWLARRSKARLLCGRRAADGTHACQGEVGSVAIGPLDPTVRRYGPLDRGLVAWPPVGYVEAPDYPGWWRPSRTAAEKIAKGQRPAFKKRLQAGYASRPAAYPWRTICPVCGDVALVTSDVLE